MKTKIIAAVVVVVIAGAAFYGGTVYGKSGSRAGGQFANASFMGGQFRTGAMGMRAGGGLTAGEIIAKDASSITIKMQDGSNKIIVLAPSTTVSKSVAGSSNDLTVGTTVTVTGSANSDGSVTAQMVQIRPAGFMVGTSTRQAQ